MQVPTIKVRDGDGAKVINAADYNPAVDTLYEAPPAAPAPTQAPPKRRRKTHDEQQH